MRSEVTAERKLPAGGPASPDPALPPRAAASILRTSRLRLLPASFHHPHTPMAHGALDTPQATLRDAERFALEILPAVSRTFALSIRVLPGDLGRAVLSAYLLCRIADTVEDEPTLPAAEKAALLDRLAACFADPAEVPALGRRLAALAGDPAHVRLAANAERVFTLYAALPERSRAHVRTWVEEMVRGMRKFVVLYPNGIRIQTLDEYREYCYYVAGTVGYMLTDLWHEHSPSIGAARHKVLRERCRAFAEALQTVNILKDVAQDAERENSIYIPEHALREHGSGHATLLSPAHLRANRAALASLVKLAWADLDDALGYFLLLPRRALSIRLFCALPLLFAYATMRDLTRSTAMLVAGGGVKISKAEVKSLLVAGPLLVASNSGVRWLVERVRLRAFVLGWSRAPRAPGALAPS
jgi:farnesyl-diphosphate farnesyltransferase